MRKQPGLGKLISGHRHAQQLANTERKPCRHHPDPNLPYCSIHRSAAIGNEREHADGSQSHAADHDALENPAHAMRPDDGSTGFTAPVENRKNETGWVVHRVSLSSVGSSPSSSRVNVSCARSLSSMIRAAMRRASAASSPFDR